MTTLTPARTPGITLADVEAIAAGEPAWLRDRRLEALRLYESMDFPDEYDEEWRRTDIRAVPAEGLGRAASGTTLPRLPEELIARGVLVTPLSSAVGEHEELVRPRLYSAIKPDEWKYLALDAAAWAGGAFVYVPANVEVAIPLSLLTSAAEGGVLLTRSVIVAEQGSRVCVVDESESADGRRSLASGAVEVLVGDGARVEYYDINRWGDDVYSFKTVRAILGRDAEFVAGAAGIGSRLTKMRIDVEMPQPGARTQLLGVTFGSGDQHFDYNTLQNHIGKHTVSDLQFKSALSGSSSLAWYGITRINPPAGGSEANQTSRNLLLSEHAKAAPIPILEIEAHDVAKCSHGATAGPVDETELFYLESRAIPRAVAEQMLVEGFFADVVDRIPVVEIRERIMNAVLAKAGATADSLTFDQMMKSA